MMMSNNGGGGQQQQQQHRSVSLSDVQIADEASADGMPPPGEPIILNM